MIGAIAFVSGGFVGYMAATWSKKENESADVARSSAAAIVHNGNVLRSIENGKTEHAVMLHNYVNSPSHAAGEEPQ